MEINLGVMKMLNPDMVRHLYERHRKQTEDPKVFNDCCRGHYKSTLHASTWGDEFINEFVNLGNGLRPKTTTISFAFIVEDP